MTRADRYLFTLLVAVIGFCAFMQCQNGAAGDKDWILNSARMLLAGKKLYSGIFSALPPLINWLYVIPTALGIVLHMPDGLVLSLFGLLMAAGCVTLSLALIRPIGFFAQSPRARIEFALLLIFMFVVWSHALYFADREHIFLVLTFPYLLRFMPSLSVQKLPLILRIGVGAMAAVGFCIKPHCALVFAAVQLFFFVQARSLRILASIENLIVYAFALTYLLLIAWVGPDYYTIVLPMTLATYWATVDREAMLFFGAAAVALFAVAFADFRLRDSSPLRRDILYFTGLCAAFLLYALTNNGWGYTWNPLDEIVLFVTGLIRWEYRMLAAQSGKSEAELRRFRFGSHACMFSFIANTIIVLGLYVMSFFVSCDASCKIDRDMQQLVQQHKASSFGFISIDFMHPATLARATGATMETRFNHIWMLPAFFVSDAAFTARHKGILDYVTHAYADDLNHNRPELMFVDDTDMFYRLYRPVDLVAYLSMDHEFREAWARYRLLASIDYCPQGTVKKQECKFDVYVRTHEKNE